jgi:hypothetical protein
VRSIVFASAFGLLLASVTPLSQARAQVIGPVGQEALETGRSGTVFTWRDPDGGASGSFVPRPAFQDESGRICRGFDQTMMVGGQPQQIRGTACRRNDGWWELRSAAVDDPLSAPRYVPAQVPVIIHTPPPVIHDYRPVHIVPAYRHAWPPYRPSVHVHVGPGRHHYRHHYGHRHHHRRW